MSVRLFWLRNIRRVRRCLTLTATQLLVQALVLSRLDYCDALLLGLPQGHISRLQRVQNSAARLVTCTPWREHISPVMMQLHWLPIAQCIEYKTLTLAFPAVNGTAPSYLCTLMDRYRSKRELRSGRGAILLQQPRFNSTSAWESGFYNSCPKTVELSPRRTHNDIRLHWIEEKTKNALAPQSLPLFVIKCKIHCDWIRVPLSHLRIGAL